MTNSVRQGRYEALDSLRGLAALSVMLLHLFLICSPAFERAFTDRATAPSFAFVVLYSPLRIFVAGSEAVILFFILSGFVLSLPFLSGAPPRYPVFVTRRVCRIYLPMVGALVVGLAIEWLLGSQHGTSIAAISGFLVMTGFSHHLVIDPVVWSLVHEMRLSLIFPVLVSLLLVSSWGWRLAAIFCLSLAAGYAVTTLPAIDDHGSLALSVLKTLLQSGRFVWFFALGIVMAQHRALIGRIGVQAPAWASVALFCVAIVLYTAGGLIPSFDQSAWADFVVGLGAAGFIVLALGSSVAQRFLGRTPILFLGRISYSLYLLHVLLIRFIKAIMPAATPLPILIVVAGAAAIVAGSIFYELVERPAMSLGRRLTTPRRQIDAGVRQA